MKYHQAIERSLVCLGCWCVLMARSPMLAFSRSPSSSPES